MLTEYSCKPLNKLYAAFRPAKRIVHRRDATLTPSHRIPSIRIMGALEQPHGIAAHAIDMFTDPSIIRPQSSIRSCMTFATPLQQVQPGVDK